MNARTTSIVASKPTMETLEGRQMYSVTTPVMPTEYSTMSLVASPAGSRDNTRGGATNLGTVSTTRSATDTVGTDAQDYYRFRVSRTGTIYMRLDGLSADADLQLFNSRGTVISSSRRSGTTADVITQRLAAGDYYARVFSYSGTNTSYKLQVSNRSIPTPPPVVPDRNDGGTNGNNNGTNDALTLLYRGSTATRSMTLGNDDGFAIPLIMYQTGNITMRLNTTWACDAVIVRTAAEAQSYVNGNAVSGWCIFDNQVGSKSTTLGAGTYYVVVRNESYGANWASVSLTMN